jgi:hypothetical protein
MEAEAAAKRAHDAIEAALKGAVVDQAGISAVIVG